MKAFIERLCEHAGIVRAGPHCEKYGDPFDYAVAFKVEGKTAVGKALIADGALTAGHVRAAALVLKEIGLTLVWERIK